ncbi:MAG: TetR/AcrR family transcriptional regulator [Chloroflexota bacterium]
MRDRCLDAADQLFYARGIRAVGIDAVRDRAGVSLKGMYNEFGSKSGLVDAYLDRRHERWMSWLESRLEQAADDPHRRLSALFEALGEWFAGSGFAGCAFINAYGEWAGTGAVASRAAWHKERLANVVGKLAEQLNPTAAAELGEELMMLIEGAIVRASLGRRSDAAKTALAIARNLVRSPTV